MRGPLLGLLRIEVEEENRGNNVNRDNHANSSSNSNDRGGSAGQSSRIRLSAAKLSYISNACERIPRIGRQNSNLPGGKQEDASGNDRFRGIKQEDRKESHNNNCLTALEIGDLRLAGYDQDVLVELLVNVPQLPFLPYPDASEDGDCA